MEALVRFRTGVVAQPHGALRRGPPGAPRAQLAPEALEFATGVSWCGGLSRSGHPWLTSTR